MIKKSALMLIVTTLMGCQMDQFEEFRTLFFDGFTLRAPEKRQPFKLQGTDSKVGGMTDGTDTLLYDLGWYSTQFENLNSTPHKRTIEAVHERATRIVIPKQPDKDLAGIYIQIDKME